MSSRNITPLDVQASKLIQKLADKLEKEFPEIQMPEWAVFVKTGPHKERLPTQRNWWYLRAASLLYQVFRQGPIGVGHLRKKYGGRKNRGSKPERKKNASGKIIRTILQQLEKAELVIKTVDGRKISPKGQRLLYEIAKEIIAEEQPESAPAAS